MSKLPYQSCNLNIWYHLPQNIWEKVPQIYEQMPGWKGFGKGGTEGEQGIPYWFGYDNDEVSICASAEPSGLSFNGYMGSAAFDVWIATFKQIATKVLGFEVGEVELGE